MSPINHDKAQRVKVSVKYIKDLARVLGKTGAENVEIFVGRDYPLKAVAGDTTVFIAPVLEG